MTATKFSRDAIRVAWSMAAGLIVLLPVVDDSRGTIGAQERMLVPLVQSINALERDLSTRRGEAGLKDQLQLDELKRLAGIPAAKASSAEIMQVKAIHQKLHAFAQDARNRGVSQLPTFRSVQQNLDSHIARFPPPVLDREKLGPMKDRTERAAREQPLIPLVQSIVALERELSMLPGTIGLKDQLQLNDLKRLAGIPADKAGPVEVMQVKALHQKLHAFAQDTRNRAVSQRATFQSVQQSLDAYIAMLSVPVLERDKSGQSKVGTDRPKSTQDLEGPLRDAKQLQEMKPTQDASQLRIRKRPIDDDPRGMKVRTTPDPAVLKLRNTWPFELVSPPHQTSGVFPITNDYYFENTAQVIGPERRTFPRGRVVVSTGQFGTGPAAWVRDLMDGNGQFDASSLSTRWNFPITARDELGTDNALLKLRDGSLLAIRNGVTWRPLAPKPAWWDHVNVGTYAKGARVGAFVFRSTDGGEHWQEQTIIDPANFDGGRYAVPRPLTNCFGGWDRIEGYADPWNGHVYLSCNAAGGPVVDYSTGAVVEPETHTHYVFKSTDNGETWQSILKFDAATPIVMTSTPNGRFYVFSVMEVGTPPNNHYQPTLFYSLNGPMFSSGKPVYYQVDGGVTSIPVLVGADPMYSHFVYKATNSISRISTDTTSSRVRLTYPWVNANGRTAIAVINVEVPNDFAAPVVLPVAMFQAIDSSCSVLASSFIDPDATGAVNWKSNTAMLYWIEGSTDVAKESYVRYCVFHGESGYSPPAIIGGPSKPTVSSGHYTYGGSYTHSDGSLNFLPLWVEAGGIRANLVTVPPDPGPVRFNAVWTKAAGNNPAVWGWALPDLDKRAIEMSMQGYRLDDLNAFVMPDGKGERYNAVWTKTAEDRPFVAGWTKQDLDNRDMELSKQGYHVQRVNAFVMAGMQGERYNAIWTKSTEDQTAVWGSVRTDFDTRTALLRSKGYQLKCLSGFCLPGEPEERYCAVWTKTAEDRPSVWGYSISDFETRAKEMNAKGYRVLDLNIHVLPVEQSERYNAIWAKTPEDHHAVWGWSRSDFDREQVKWRKNGYVLTEVNAYARP
ncbi:MAG: sialidase family protein [Pirellula sp.]